MVRLKLFYKRWPSIQSVICMTFTNDDIRYIDVGWGY